MDIRAKNEIIEKKNQVIKECKALNNFMWTTTLVILKQIDEKNAIDVDNQIKNLDNVETQDKRL